MFCSKCGKKVEKGIKFCPSCGEKVVESKVEEKKEVKKEVVKAEPVKKEEPVKTNTNQGSSGLGIASMIIGIVSFILSWFLSLFIILIPIAGLILGLCAKGKKGFKITGIVLNALSILIAIVVFIAGLAMLGKGIGTAIEEGGPKLEEGLKTIEKTVKSGYPYVTWTCVSYYSSEATQYSDDITKAPNKSQ